MASEIEICNSALIKVGVDTIKSLEEGSKRSRLCKEQYPKIRDELLESHPWNFAIGRATLAKDAASPAFGFTNQFILPSDVLRVLRLQDEDSIWKREDNKILTDDATVKIIYIKRVVDPSRMTPRFREALAYRLAMDIAYSLKQSTQLASLLEQKATKELARAKAYDGQEGTPEDFIRDVFINSRL